MKKTQFYESPEISTVEIAGEQAFAVANGSNIEGNISRFEIEEEEW